MHEKCCLFDAEHKNVRVQLVGDNWGVQQSGSSSVVTVIVFVQDECSLKRSLVLHVYSFFHDISLFDLFCIYLRLVAQINVSVKLVTHLTKCPRTRACFSFCRRHPWSSCSALNCWPSGRAIDPASRAWFITKFISFNQVVCGPVQP